MGIFATLPRRCSRKWFTISSGIVRKETLVSAAVNEANGRIPSLSPASDELLFSKKTVIQTCQRHIRKGTKFKVLAYVKICGSSLLFATPEERVDTAEYLLDALWQHGEDHSTALFNMLLQVYTYNNHQFTPSKYLERMCSSSCQPNEGTYSQLLAAYCNQGNIKSAQQILNYMKSRGQTKRPADYAAMVTGYSRAGNVQDAEKLLQLVKPLGRPFTKAVFASLMKAYAEHGLLKKIVKADRRKRNEGDNCDSVYLDVVDSLSQYGHGKLVEDVIPLIKDMPLLSHELRHVCYSCLARGEHEVPWILIKLLSPVDGVTETLLTRYLSCAARNGLRSLELWLSLQECLDLSKFPNLPLILMTTVMFSDTYSGFWRKQWQYPHKGDLKPHPWGNCWVEEARYVILLVESLGKRQNYFYYPLFARHCSEANIRETVVTLYQMLSQELFLDKITLEYISHTFLNAGVGMDDWIDSQVMEGSDDLWLTQMLVFQLTLTKLNSLSRTLQLVRDLHGLWCKERILVHAMKHLRTKKLPKTELESVIETLSKHGAPRSLLSTVQDEDQPAQLGGGYFKE